MIVNLLERSVKLKVEADNALDHKISPQWDKLKTSLFKGINESSPLRIHLQACLNP